MATRLRTTTTPTRGKQRAGSRQRPVVATTEATTSTIKATAVPTAAITAAASAIRWALAFRRCRLHCDFPAFHDVFGLVQHLSRVWGGNGREA